MEKAPVKADSYLERIAAGLCFVCSKPYGVAPQDRHLLPRVERGDRWEFLAPCGHAVLGVKKGSQLEAEGSTGRR